MVDPADTQSKDSDPFEDLEGYTPVHAHRNRRIKAAAASVAAELTEKQQSEFSAPPTAAPTMVDAAVKEN